MRAGLGTIQQTLTPEASAVLNRAIADASRRRHGQTTPLHVAAALLSSPSGHLRQACLRSHPNPSSSHPLQCRALELCFSVALDRLPSSSSSAVPPSNDSPPPSPPISNALMAALKRAQAHQRRGCPESQQQPLLAVKVELDHLILSILDDPSVSRVMREASFSSPAVKGIIEGSLSSSPSPSPSPSPARNLYLNPRLVSSTSGVASPAKSTSTAGDLAKMFDVLTRTKKHNPILVGDADPGVLLREAIRRIEAGDSPAQLRSVAIISTEKEFSFSSSDRSQIPSKVRELTRMVEMRIAAAGVGGVVVDVGDLNWLVEGATPQQGITHIGREAVTEMALLVQRFGGSSPTVWLVGTATCATYLRCQVYFPTMETDWDLQALPIAPRSTPIAGLLPRIEPSGMLSSKLVPTPPMGFPSISVPGMTRSAMAHDNRTGKDSICSMCTDSYERELKKLGEREPTEKFTQTGADSKMSLPHWLHETSMPSPKLQPAANQSPERQLIKKWRDICSSLHRKPVPNTTKTPAFSFPSTTRSPINSSQPKLSIHSGNQLSAVLKPSERLATPPGSPVTTDLALGPLQKPPVESAPTKFTGDAASIKRLVNGLLDKVSWQAEAASSAAAAVIQSKSGGGRRRAGSVKADTWLLFAGPDRVGKQKMANALADLVFGAPPLIVRLGSLPAVCGDDAGESYVSLRGRTSIDRVVDTLRLNPFSTIIFEDFDRTDCTFRGMVRRAMERGRLSDSHGREVGLGSSIFILTTTLIPEDFGCSNEELRRSEERVMDMATSGRRLQLLLEDKTNKRRPEWLFKDERHTKPRKDSISLDLNLATAAVCGRDEDTGEGSWISSDLTVEHEQEHRQGHLVIDQSMPPPTDSSSWGSGWTELIDAAIVFKPVDFGSLRSRVSKSVSSKFVEIMGQGWSIAIDDDALDQMVGGVWLSGNAHNVFDEWIERVLAPAVAQLRENPNVDDGVALRLTSVKSGRQLHMGWLPAMVEVAVDGS